MREAIGRYRGHAWAVARIALVVMCLVLGPGRAMWAMDDPECDMYNGQCPWYVYGELVVCGSPCTWIISSPGQGTWSHCQCQGSWCGFLPENNN